MARRKVEKVANYRQGDVFLWKATHLPKGAKPGKDRVLAYGEATGHRHEIFDGEVFVGENGAVFVKATGETTLQHVCGGAQADHAVVPVEEGIYRVTTQREYEPDGWRAVSD